MNFSLSRLLTSSYPLLPTRNSFLILQLTRREVTGRYKGSMLGMAWSLLLPLLMLATYTVVFRDIFKARWPGAGESTSLFALNILAGLVLFNFFSEVVGRSPKLILEQPNLVKRVVFPLESLVWVNIASGLFNASLGLLVLALGVGLAQGGLPWSAAAAPLVLVVMVPSLLCLGWIMASVGVYLRDLGQVIGPLLNLMLFLTPVLFPASSLPDSVQALLYLNPLTLPIEALRACMLLDTWPKVEPLLLQAAVSWVLAGGAYWVFNRLKRDFADQL